MSKKIDYTGQIIGTRKIIKNYCEQIDWDNSGLSKKQDANKWRLGQCLICGAIMPVDVKTLKRHPPKKCSYCSNIGHKSINPTQTNSWTVYSDYANVNINYKSEIISAQIDVDDYEKCCQKIWRVSKKRNKYYIISGSDDNQIYLHQFIFGKPTDPNLEIDHIDGNSLNNRKANLRYLTRSDNARFIGERIDNQIGIRGISYNKKNKTYVVDFSYNHRRFYFKHWKTLEEAVWCRFCCEQYFNLLTLIRNPLFEQYNTLSNSIKNDINNYVIQKIKEKSSV